MTSDEKIERELLARLSRLLDNRSMLTDEREHQVEIARGCLRQFYARRGLHNGELYFRVIRVDEQAKLVPFEPAPSVRVRQDGWGDRG